MSVVKFPHRHGTTAASGVTRNPVTAGARAADPADLAARLAGGDAHALDEILARYYAPLVAYASRFAGDADAAQDAVQEAFLRLWQRRFDRAPLCLQSYLFRIVRNLLIDESRRREARRKWWGRWQAESPSPPTPEETLDEERRLNAVDRAIQALPPRAREVFTLAHLHGLSYEQVAEVMDISSKTVANHMTAALSKLRISLRSTLDQTSTAPARSLSWTDRST